MSIAGSFGTSWSRGRGNVPAGMPAGGGGLPLCCTHGIQVGKEGWEEKLLALAAPVRLGVPCFIYWFCWRSTQKWKAKKYSEMEGKEIPSSRKLEMPVSVTGNQSCSWRGFQQERPAQPSPALPPILWHSGECTAHPCSWGSAALRSKILLRREKLFWKLTRNLGSCVTLMIKRWHQKWTSGRISL